MKSSSLKPTRSWPSLFCTFALACTTLFLAASPSHAQLLITDFEAEEDFEAGEPISGSGGWTNGSVDFVVTDDRSYSGLQSLRVGPVTTYSGGNLTARGLLGPDVLEHGFGGVSLWMASPETVPKDNAVVFRIRVVLGDTIGGTPTAQRALQFQFAYQSNSDSANFTLGYWDDVSTSRTTTVSKSVLDLTQWTQFRFEMNPADLTYSVRIGDTEVLSGIPIGGTVTTASRLHQVQFWGHTSQTHNGYYDQITGIAAIPEPSALALLGGALAGGLLLRARRRKVKA